MLRGKSGKAAVNDLFLIHPDDTCTLIPEYSTARIVLAILDAAFFSQWIADTRTIVCNPLEHPQINYEQLRISFISFITASMDADDEIHMQHVYFSLMDTLNSQFRIHTAPETPARPAPGLSMDAIGNYLHSNYRFPVSLDDLANDFHISGAHLSRFIKKKTGTGFHEYLMNIRLEHAVDALLNTEATITEISYNSGFPNVAAFNKAFRARYNQTPNIYRRENRKVPVTQQKTDRSGILAGDLPHPFTPAQVIAMDFDPSTAIPLKRVWKDMINIGDAANGSHTRFQEQLSDIVHRFGFKYARVTALFKDLTPELYANPALYPFLNVESFFDLLEQLNLTPHIDMGILCREDHPDYHTLNEVFLEYFIKYILKRYGYEKLRTWRFEYTISDGCMDIVRTLDNYRLLYKIVKEYIPEALVGGFGLKPLDEERFMGPLMEALGSGRVSLDFFSLHIYPYSRYGSGDIHHIPEPRFISDFTKRCSRRLAQIQPDPIPIYVTHVQYEDVNISHANDSAFIAPYLLTVCLLIYPYIHTLCFAPFSDIDSSSGRDNDYFTGGCGMVTRSNIRKPSWFALFALIKNGTHAHLFHPGCLVTALPNKIYQIILCNYAPYNECYDYEGIFHRPVSNSRRAACELKLNRLPPGNYRVQRLSVGPEHGSAFEKYKQMGIRDHMLPVELEYLRCQAMFDVSVEYLTVRSDIVLNEVLDIYEMRIIVLSKCV